MSRKKISTIKESETGRNESFKDNYTGKTMSRSSFVKEIKRGKYDNYHIRKINDIDTPVSNPDSKKK